MAKEYLDKTGLQYFWSKVKAYVDASSGGSGGASLSQVYPVGSIYMSTSSTSPATLFGIGTWERITGRFLLAATDGGAAGGNSTASVAAGNTGGEASHTLSSAESGVPAHKHSMTSVLTSASVSIASNKAGTASSGISDIMRDTNGIGTLTSVNNNTAADASSAHNNMPPYLAVYVWKRTA